VKAGESKSVSTSEEVKPKGRRGKALSISQGKKKDKNKLPANDLAGWSYLCPLTQAISPTAAPDTVEEFNGFMQKIKRMNIMNAESLRTERMEAARKGQRPPNVPNQDRTDRTRSASFSLY
jgi:hypothetical protein